MNTDPLDQMLASYADQPLPASPLRLTEDVWREIRQRSRKSVWTRLLSAFGWHAPYIELRLVLSGLGLALVVGLLPAYLVAKPRTEVRLARASLHFEVFSSAAPLALLTESDPL